MSPIVCPLPVALPVITPRGRGEAIIMIDYGREHHLCWVVVLNNGVIWTFENPNIRVQPNTTIGRVSIDIPPDWDV